MSINPENIIPKDTPLLSSPTVDELLIGCYLTLQVLECEDLERELSTEVIEELIHRKENQQNK